MIIYAVKVEDIRLSSVLNYVKYLCAPNSKTEIHLSVQGPFRAPIRPEKFEKFNTTIKNALIKIDAVGNFFEFYQNTVYLRCGGNAIRRVWDKKDYPFMPHLTLYDGANSEFATELYGMLKEFTIDFTFKSSGLICYDTEKLVPSTLLKLGINTEVINSVLGFDWRTKDSTEYSQEQKLDLIKRCFASICTQVEHFDY